MADLTRGERQRREVNSYNLFYSAITDRAEPPLYAHGTRLPMMFPVVEDRSGEIKAEPDFVLYDGSTCALVEVKSGKNINDRHIQQMQKCAEVDNEGAENALKDAKVQEEMGLSGEVRAVEPIIVYQDLDEAYIETFRHESEGFAEALEEITKHAVVMAQDYGGKLRVLEGEFNEDLALQSVLRSGVKLPQNPPDTLMLTESMEPEIVAIAICDIWGMQAVDHDGGVSVSRSEVRDHFAPRHNVSLDKLSLVFEFLENFGACEATDDNEYVFKREHMGQILDVESILMEKTVENYLHGSEQAQFGQFEDDG